MDRAGGGAGTKGGGESGGESGAGGDVFQRRWSQNHDSGRSRTAASSSAAWRAVRDRTASGSDASPCGTIGGCTRISKRPSRARTQARRDAA